jgi:hypothetical protein
MVYDRSSRVKVRTFDGPEPRRGYLKGKTQMQEKLLKILGSCREKECGPLQCTSTAKGEDRVLVTNKQKGDECSEYGEVSRERSREGGGREEEGVGCWVESVCRREGKKEG